MKTTQRIICTLMALIMMFGLISAADFGVYADTNTTVMSEEDKAIADGVVDQFMPLTKIPRQSHKEEKVSEYLYKWASDRGFEAKQDDAKNVIFDVPATKGMENVPMTILQAHMDMVIAVEKGKQFNPDTDGITVINDGRKLTADGTSLGADDGIGVATILYLIENNKNHGPLRIIFTTNEEDGMTGVESLDVDIAEDVQYTINFDYEKSDETVISSAGGRTVNYSTIMDVEHPYLEEAVQIDVFGLLGGHSGIDIHRGRLNAIKAISHILHNIESESIPFELASITGGSAHNAIPTMASAVIVINPEDADKLLDNVMLTFDLLKYEYGEVEKGMEYNVAKCDMPDYVFSSKWKENAISFIYDMFDGVNSKYTSDLIESSSNLGLVSFVADVKKEATATTFTRSAERDKLDLIVNSQLFVAGRCGFETHSGAVSDPWPADDNSKLLKAFETSYKKITGEEIKVIAVHAGLETGAFAKLNPYMDIISIGFDISDPHTVNETCNITTIPKTYKVVSDVLATMKPDEDELQEPSNEDNTL